MNDSIAQTPLQVLEDYLGKPLTPVVFFMAGVTYDTVTLNRIDRLFDNLLLLLYLSLLGALVILCGRQQLGALPAPTTNDTAWTALRLVDRARPYFGRALQFLLGGLFSAYTIFYFQSASLTPSSLFLVVILMLLVANERLQHHRSSLTLLVALYAMVVFSFFTFFLPVATGVMATWVFVLGAVLSGAVLWQVIRLVFAGTPDAHSWEPVRTWLPACGLIAILTACYFLNWIPPVPLSLKMGGFYQQVEKVDGVYHLTYDSGAWYEVLKNSEDRVSTTEPVYCFTSVFAPTTLDTTIYHHWQHRVPGEDAPFVTTDRIPIHISGGRDAGYRSYTVKQRLEPGEWRVDVETEHGRIIGRMFVDADEIVRDVREPVTIVR